MRGQTKTLLAFFLTTSTANNTSKRNKLTPAAQKTTGAFKLISEQKKTLEKSLKITQDELERYREKFHETDKAHAVEVSRHSILLFHEILKFVISTVCGGLGVNMISDKIYREGIAVIVLGIMLYFVVVWFDRKK